MSFILNKAPLLLEQVFNTIKCSNANCRLEFMLFGIIRFEVLPGDEVTKLMEQLNAFFCPYCGTKNEGKEK